MPQAGFKPTIPVFDRAKTVRALDCVATVTTKMKTYRLQKMLEIKIS
jgi:hypothetical protein